MAEALKDQYGPEVVDWLAQQICQVYPAFNATQYRQAVLPGFDSLELMARGKHMAQQLHHFLPHDYPQAVDTLVRSMGVKLQDSRSFSMSAFYYLPHSFYISEFGLDDFEPSMAAMYQLTQRFTAEFCIRPFLLRYPQQTLARLHQWLADPNEHVRRLVSEGTRPRLPWGMALKPFKQDPAAVLPLLEQLKDDESLYVRRSVANNLNDIGKDNLAILCDVCRRWLTDADDNRRWLINHALRSAIKRAEPEALAVLGYDRDIDVAIDAVSISPQQARLGDQLTLQFCLTNRAAAVQSLLVDLVIYYVKANGRIGAKVFKLKTLQLDGGESVLLSKRVSLKNMSTRKHYAGRHVVHVLINGVSSELGQFQLQID